jgi:uncharacterized phage-associated protein
MRIIDVANYFIHRSLLEGEDGVITNLKIQKLCYYAQGFHLALHNAPLFDEPLEAWKHGPVSRSLYGALADYGANPVTALIPSEITIESITVPNKTFLDEIYNEFAQFSAWALREMTHKETPWTKNWNTISQTGRPISNDDLREFFLTKLPS